MYASLPVSKTRQLFRKFSPTWKTWRTLGQHALPITFGKKVAVWATANRRNIDRLDAVYCRLGTLGVMRGAVVIVVLRERLGGPQDQGDDPLHSPIEHSLVQMPLLHRGDDILTVWLISPCVQGLAKNTAVYGQDLKPSA